MGWCCGLGELSRGGSPNVTGGCEKMGNWRSRSGQAILRECRPVGSKKTVDIPEPGSRPPALPAATARRGGQSSCANSLLQCDSDLVIVSTAGLPAYTSSSCPSVGPNTY